MAPIKRLSTRRYAKGEQTREQILDAAKRLFTQRGYHHTSVYDLFEKASITKGAFYHHWKTKEDLALTILEEMRAAYETRIFPLLTSGGPPRARIESAIQALASLNNDPDWVYCKLLARWSTELGPEDMDLGTGVHNIRLKFIRSWTELLSQAQARGELRRDISPEGLGILVIGLIWGVHLVDLGSPSESSSQALNAIRRLLFEA